VGGYRETGTTACFITANIYILMKNKTDIQQCNTHSTTSTTLPIQKNKRNFSTIASRVRASPRRRYCRCRIPGPQGRKVRRRIRHRTAAVVTTARLYCCCRRNSHADITDRNGYTTRLVDHRSVPWGPA